MFGWLPRMQPPLLQLLLPLLFFEKYYIKYYIKHFDCLSLSLVASLLVYTRRIEIIVRQLCYADYMRSVIYTHATCIFWSRRITPNDDILMLR